MRQQHANIPWGPIIPHEVYEGYKAFVKRQQERLIKYQRDGQKVIYKGILTNAN